MNTRTVSAVAILLSAALAGCPRSQPVPDPPVATDTPMADPADPADPDAPAQGPLASTLQVEQLADSLHFQLQVTNRTPEPLELTFPTGQSFDFVVEQQGRELWRWSAERMFTQAIRMETLAPGETRSYEAGWRLPPGVQGRVAVRGWLATTEHRAEQRTEVELP